MVEIIKGFLKRLVPKNLAGIIGVVQKVVPIAREFIVVGCRLVAIFIPKAENLIEPIGDVFDRIDEAIEVIKNWFLDVGE